MSLIRIAKFMAECGVASRRKSEELILAGKVRVNGVIISDMSLRLGDDDNVAVFNKRIVRNTQVRVWLFYKPRGVLTTSFDPQGRKIIYDLLPKRFHNLITVGRLDYNTEGLILFTNNGDFSRKLELPTSRITREYRVRVMGDLDADIINKIKDGLVIDGIHYRSCEIFIEDENIEHRAKNFWIRMILTEGKNREIRKILEHFNLTVSKLIRTAYGPFNVEGLSHTSGLIEVPTTIVENLINDLV